MKVIDYLGAEGSCIVIEQPTDIFPLLDWAHSRMIEKQEKAKGSVNVEKWKNAIDFLAKQMEEAEAEGFGSMDNVEEIEY